MTKTLETKKIARNTLLLYFRMILGMLVSLYTSRVVLKVLGVDDFGIYNIIGGVIVMFSFINSFLTSACQRYISFSIVRDSVEETRKVFSTSLFIHILVFCLFAVFAETIGLWFVYNKLVLPECRFDVSVWVFHIMVIESCISIFKVPYNAAIIAEEKMDFYAYTSIVENILRLLVVYLLVVSPFDKLLVYALLHILVSLIIFMWYKVYSEKKFSYCVFSIKYDIVYLKQMLSFSGWNLFGSIADIGYMQGTNIILNLFYGVALNAAMGIATTVRSSIYSFITNIQIAANPQIIKSYAIDNIQYYRNLVFKISKYSYFLMLLLAIPVMLNIEFILNVWLEEVPDFSASLINLGLIFCLIDCLHGPLWISMQATGRIKYYQILVSFVLLLNLPFSYLALYHGYSPNSIMIVQIIVSFLVLLVRLIFSCKYAKLNILGYIASVILPSFLVTLISLPLPLYIASLFNDSLSKLLLTGFLSTLVICFSVLFFGMSKGERMQTYSFVTAKLSRFFSFIK